MAARKGQNLSQRWRDKIKTSMLINRLQAFALSENDPQTKKPVEMSRDQITAAVTLLKKTMPDLASQTNDTGSGPQEFIIKTNVDRSLD